MNWDDSNPNTNGEYFLISAIGNNWRLCFDIGANRGEYTNMLRRYSPRAKIISFEPNPEAARYIKKSRKVRVEVIAVGDKKSSLIINFNEADDTQSSSYRSNEHTKPTKVKQISIDEYIKQKNVKHMDFIKIDTEGHELPVFQGAENTIRNQLVDFVQFEYGGTYKDARTKLAPIYKLLAPYYIICHILPNGLLPLDYSKDIETFRYSNWLAISRNIYRYDKEIGS
jgi:FkbM family methyltransferase